MIMNNNENLQKEIQSLKQEINNNDINPIN